MKHAAHITAPTADEMWDAWDAEADAQRLAWANEDARAMAAMYPDYDEHDPDRMPLDPSAQPSSSNLEFYQRRNS